jgi:hypothetical protein
MIVGCTALQIVGPGKSYLTDLTDKHSYFSLLRSLYTDLDNQKALQHFKTAHQLAHSPADQRTIMQNIGRLRTEKWI